MTERLNLYLDIDDTLATGVVHRHLRLYNRLLGLNMTPEEVQDAGANYRKTFDVPQIQTYRNQGQEFEDRFQQVRGAIRISRSLHRTLATIPNVHTGLKTLLNSTNNQGYFTVRPKEVDTATEQWLTNNNFPEPNVTICQNHQDKIQKILDDGDSDQIKILIDDSLSGLVKAATELSQQGNYSQELANFVIVGFGYTQEEINSTFPDFTEQTGAKLLALPDWDQTNVVDLTTKLASI